MAAEYVKVHGDDFASAFKLDFLLEEIAGIKEMELAQASKRFAQLRLRETEKKWTYHPWFGVHGALDL